MSDFFDNDGNESTVFADPEKDRDKERESGNKKKKFIPIIALFCVLLLLIGGTVAVIKLVPDKENKDENNDLKIITVVDIDKEKIKSAKFTNDNGTFDFYKEKSDDGDIWYVSGVDKELSSSDVISSKISSASSIRALKKITAMKPSDCGLESPKYKAEFTLEDGKKTSVLVGNEAPDKTGTYMKTDGSDEIFLVNSDTPAEFNFGLLDLADASSIPAEFAAEDGSDSVTFDSITVSGKHFEKEIVLKPNTEEKLSSVIAYVVVSPIKRAADNFEGTISLFTSGVEVAGLYSYDCSPESLKAVGLNDPDIIVTAKVGSKSKTYKISVVDENYCAIISDNSKVIKKVNKSNLDFADFGYTDYYSSIVCMEMLNKLSSFKLETKDAVYDFSIKYNGEEEKNKFTVKCGDKKIKSKDFQSFYETFVSLQSNDFSTNGLTVSPDAKVTLSYSDGSAPMVIEFRKVSEIKYEYSVDSVPLGKISSTSYNKIVKGAKKLVS